MAGLLTRPSAVLRVLGKLFCHALPLNKFGYLCAQRSTSCLTPRGDTLSKELYGYHQSVIAGFPRECCNYDHVLSSGVELEGLANKVLAREYMTVCHPSEHLPGKSRRPGKS
jgi:hypothetical protein